MALRRFVKKLPGVLQTEVQKEFYAATFDQVFNPANVEAAQGFIGRRGSDVLDPLVDNYLEEPTKLRAAYQLEPIAYAVNAALEDTNQFFYEDLVNYIDHKGGNTGNHDRLFADLYYSFAPPIDVDKYLNYQNYLWLEGDGSDPTNTAPIAYVTSSLSAANFDLLIEGTYDAGSGPLPGIIGATSYNTAEATGLLFPSNFALTSGMRITFEGSASYEQVYYVESVGRGIRLVTEKSVLGFDGTGATVDLSTPDYMTIERGSCEGSPWSRTNRWFHEDAVDAVTQLGQLQGGTIIDGGAGYNVGDILFVNLGDGIDGAFIVTEIDNGGAGPGEVTMIDVYARGSGYTFAQVDQTGTPSPSVPLQWDSEDPLVPSARWDPVQITNNPSGFVTIVAQTEANYVAAITTPNSFDGGTGYAVGEVITMSDGTILTVVAEVGNVVTEFVINNITDGSTPIPTQTSTLTTVSSDAAGNDDFILYVGSTTVEGVYFWDDDTITIGAGANVLIDGNLGTAVSRSNKADRPILEYTHDIELFDHGNRYVGEVNVAAATEAFGDVHGQAVGVAVDGIVLTTGMLLIFLDPDTIPDFLLWDELPIGGAASGTYWDIGPWEVEGVSGAITRFVWEVDATGPTIVLTPKLLPIPDPIPAPNERTLVNVGEAVTVTQGDTWAGYSFYQFENISTEEFNWRAGQQKFSIQKQPLYNLYDTNGFTLNDTLEYPVSNFAGNELFSYKVLTQATLNAQGGGQLVDDSVLGFPLETQGFRQLGDVIFENDLESTRYTYVPVGMATTEINGYYFYNQYQASDVDCSVLDANMNPIKDYLTNWKSSTAREIQRVIDRYLSTQGQSEFPVSVVPILTDTGSVCVVVASGRRLNTSEFAYQSSSQTMKLFEQSTERDGKIGTGTKTNFVFNIQENIEVTVNDVYQEAGVQYTVTDTTPGNMIVAFVVPPASGVYIEATNRAASELDANTVVEILSCTYDIVTDDQLGYFEIPNGLENNPNNLEIMQHSWNEFTPHFTSIITEQAIYEGAAFGAGNNYRDTAKDGSLGTFALQNQSPMIKAMFTASNADLDIVDAIRFNGSEYTRFKNKYVKVAQQLLNEGFTDFNAANPINISEWVDEILRRIVRGREYDTAFDNTYMMAWNNVYEEQEYTAGGISGIFTTSNFVDLELKQNVMYVYVDGVIQCIDRDYDISNFNPIQITFPSNNIPIGGASVVIRLYEDTTPAHIPATPSKLGLWKMVRPSIITDNTYVNPTDLIIGHDGSRTPVYGSQIDNLLVELETRIYNGTIEKFRLAVHSGDSGTYKIPLVRDTHKPGKFRTTRWLLDEWNDLIKQVFFKWAARNKADYISNGYYDNSDLWSWNYASVVDVDGVQLPSGYWRGMFDHYYDTQTPESTPWEMLGFHEMPIWWEAAPNTGDGWMGYGVGPWANTDPIWVDIEAGLVRRKYDPINGEPNVGTPIWDFLVAGEVDERYVRTDLVAKYLPVDGTGALKATPLECIDTTSSLLLPSTAEAQADYTWGDWAPIEYAWRTSEEYPYAVQEALFLARPGEFGEKMWDPEHIFEVPVDQEQIVTDEDDLRKRIGNDVLYVHGETKSGVIQINTGYQVWITGRLLTLKKDPALDFGGLLRTLDVKLGHKMAGFTDKDTMRVFVEGISVSSAATNLLVPAENIDVSLYTGAPSGDYMYSGVLIKAITSNQYQIFGYDILKGEFKYYERNGLSGVSSTNVGGQPALFSTYVNGTTYTQGDIVRLNGIFYRALETHLSDGFDPTKWAKLQSLPITGGVSVSHKAKNTGTVLTLEYGSVLSGYQEVYDFLIGLGEVQEEDGWKFEEPNLGDGGINDWRKVAKDFLFWVGTQWEEDSLIMLSPLGEKVVLEVAEGYPGNVEKISNGVYSILDKMGVAIDPNATLINRNDRRIEIVPDLDQIGIYGLRASTYETENIVTFDNVTVFNDIIYDPVLGSRLDRLDFRGRRTLGWTGKLEAAGFIITADGLLPNYENMVDSIRNYHNTEVQLDAPDLENTARHLIGFDERDYFTDLGVLDDAQFQFYQGLVRQKGTRQAIEKLERNSLVTSIDDELNVVEEWALKLGEFGAVCRNQFTEFLIAASEVKDDPQLVQLSYPSSSDIGITKFLDGDDVDDGANTFTIISHGFATGNKKVYTDISQTGTSDITELTSGASYSVIVVDDDTIQLAEISTPTVAITLSASLVISTDQYSLETYVDGIVTDIDIVSATNIYVIAPTVFITNHPDDAQGSGASATSVLDTDGTLLRIDILTQGTGYLEPPQIAIGLPTITSTSDRATSRIHFDIAADVTSDDVIIIDIDDETRWITKPNSIACDVALELWPEAALETYRTTNAGYVHKNDVTFQAFDVDAIDNVINNTTLDFTQGQTIWLARDPSEEFGVYYLDNYKVSTIDTQDETDFDGVTEGEGSFVAGTDYGVAETIIMSDGTELLVATVDGSGAVLTFDITVESTTAVAGRGSTTLTAVSSNVNGNNDFTLTLGVLNEQSGSTLSGTAATLIQNPTVANDGRVTFGSLPREDVVKALIEIEVSGSPVGDVTDVTVLDGGFGYNQPGTFTISRTTHGSERNTNEEDAIISYTVSNGIVDGATVTTAGSGYGRNVATSAVNASGSGYAIGDVLTITGGTALNSAADFNATQLTTVAAQDETDFNASPADEGTFDAGTGHSVADVITLTDGSTITVDAASISTIISQDETDYATNFTGGGGYLTGESISMSDGTVVQVTSGTIGTPAAITAFKIISITTSTTLGTLETLAAIQTSGSGGTGFTMTLVGANEAATATTGLITEFTVTTASTTGITTNDAIVSQASSTGLGINFALNMGRANQGVFAIIISDAGSYSTDPSTTNAATSVLPPSGTGATFDMTITGDNITVVDADVPAPIGWNRYLGNTVPGSGSVFVEGILYDYTYISGFDFTLSKDGTLIEDNTITDNSAFFTLMNLRYETMGERTLFGPEMTLAGATQTWVDNNGNGLWETDSFSSVTVAGALIGGPVVALTGFGGEGAAPGLSYSSDNDIDTWNSVNISSGISFPSPGGLAYSESLDMWVAMTKKGNSGSTNLSYSTDDGVTWTDRGTSDSFTTATGSAGECLDWSPTLGLFCVGGNSGQIAKSSDGINWTNVSPGIFGSSQVVSIYWSSGHALFFAGGTGNEVGYSSDGDNWTVMVNEPGGASSVDVDAIYSVGTRVFVTRDNGTIYYSDDVAAGDTWTQSTISGTAIGSADLAGIVGNTDNSVIIAGAAQLNNANFVWRSIDNGVTFASVDVGTQVGIATMRSYCLTYSADYGFIQGGADSTADEQIITTSPDGLTWTLRLSEKGTHFDASNNPVTITSVGTLATLTSGSDPFLTNGTTVIISGADQSEYNGTFTVANETALTFEYTMLSDPAIDTATGTIELRYLDQVDIDAIAAQNILGPASVAYTHTALRTEDELIETYKFESAYVYDNLTKDTLAQIPVYDPFKGILPGTAAQNLRYINQHDPARYTNASTASLVNKDLAFDGDQQGLLWWDTSTSAYLYYEQGTDQYRRDNWGKLFSGSSVDVYEWIRSTVTPEAYEDTEASDGTIRNTTDYVVSEEWDPILEEVRTFYYFWVKDRTAIPVGINRTVAAFEVANIINNPAANLYQWFSPISQTGFMFSGVDGVFTDSDNVFQINYRRDDQELTAHVEWELGREDDTTYTPNDLHWDKMVDSLCGYTAEIDITAEAYTNEIGSFNTATGLDTPTANAITCIAAHGFTDGEGVIYNAVDTDTDFIIADVGLIDGQMYYVEVISDTELALHPSSVLAFPLPPTPPNPASRVNVFNSAESETHTLTMMTRNALNNFANALPTAADPERGYLIVPDPTLSTANQLGIRIRPVQTMFMDIQAARRVWRDKINNLVEFIVLRDVNPTWNASLTTNNLWEWIDWYADGYDATNTVPVRQVADTSDLALLPNPLDGDIVKVTTTRYSLYVYNIDTGLYDLIGREASRLNILEDVYVNDPSLAIALELRELIEALRTQVFVGDIEVNNNLVFFAMLNYVFSEQDDLDWAFKTTYVFLDQTAGTLTQDRVFQTDPFDAALDYVAEAKPYQTKVRDFRITRATELDEVEGTAEERTRTFNVSMLFDQIRGGNLSVTEMRIAKYEMSQDTSYNGYSTLDSGTTNVRLGAAGRAVSNYRIELQDIQAPTGGTLVDMDVDIAGGQVSAVIVNDTGTGYTNGTGLSFFLLVTAGGGDGLAEIDYDIIGGSFANVSVANTGSTYLNGLGTAINSADFPATNIGTTLLEFDPSGTGAATTIQELTSVATINASITDEFFFDFQGSILRNTSFGGLPTLESFALVLDEEGNTAAGTGYIVGDILALDAGSGIPVSNALIRVDTITGSGGILTADLISGGSYTQTPTVDPVDLNGGTGTSAQVTTLIFENGSAIPFDTTPWDQIGFESSAQDESVTTLTGSPDGFATTIPGQTQADYDGTGESGTFTVGTGYVAGASSNDWTSLAFDGAGDPDTITRTGGTDFLTDGFLPGQEILINNADDLTNNGSYIIGSNISDVTATTITLTAGGILASDGPDTNATISRFDRIELVDGSDVRVDSVSGSAVSTFTIVEGSESFLPTGSILTQLTTSGSGIGFQLTLGIANETSGTFADVQAEEEFSGNGNTTEFTIITDTPTFFMFAVVDDIEQVLNVDYFFIGDTLTFVSILDSTGTRSFGAPPSGTDNVQLFTYIEAGDLVNPQVTAGITEEMVPLDPRENFILIADTHNVALNAAGTGYATGEILTVVGGTGTAMTLLVTGDTGGLIDSVVIIDSGAYTVLPGAGAAVTSNLAGNDDATIDVTEFSFSFRLHNNTRQEMFYVRNEDALSTTLDAEINSTLVNIPVADETLLYTTDPSISEPQVAWIGTERIVYHGVQTIGAQDYLIGVIRGTGGTHPPLINHPSGTRVYGTEGQNVDIDPYIYWTNTLTAGYATSAGDGTWRYHGAGIVHFTDISDLTIHSGNSMAIGDTLRCTSGANIQKSYFISEFINTGELSRIDILDAGTGYSAGDIINTANLDGGGGLGPPTTSASLIVGEVDALGGVIYVTVLDRGTGYTSGSHNFNLVGEGDGMASITVYTDREGLVLLQAADIINASGIVVARNGVTWFADRANPGGLTTATTTAAAFLNGGDATTILGSGNALSIPSP